MAWNGLSHLLIATGPCVRISYNEVSVNHPEALRILAAQIRKGDYYKLLAVPNISYNNLMSELDPERHAAMRSNVAPAYSLSNMLKSESFIDRSVTLLERRLDESLEKGRPFELGRWLHFFTWDMVGEIHFSSPFGFLHQGRDVGNTMKNGFKLAFYITTMGYMQWLHSFLFGNPILRWLDFQPNEQALSTSVSAIEKRKKNPEARADMMQHWMDQHAKYPDRMTEKNITCAVLVAVGAGGDTVGSVLQAIFYLLLKEDPSHLEHLRQEIDASGTDSPVVSYAEAQKMPYLQAVVWSSASAPWKSTHTVQIKESQRIYPGVAWNLPRVVPKEGFTVAGRHFTQGVSNSRTSAIINANKA